MLDVKSTVVVGNDALVGGAGKDKLYGGGGTDVLYGDELNVDSESIYNDELYGNAGNDFLFGGGGDDTLYGDNRDPNDTAATGNDVLVGGIGKDVLYGGAGEDELYGDRKDVNDIADSHGDDFLVGGKGKDKLYGGAGNDKLAGGLDDDRLVGGFGVDTYIINTGDGKDTIVDADRSVLVRNGQRFVGFFEKQGDSYVLVTDARVKIQINSPAKLDFGGDDTVTFENLTSEDLVNQNLAWVHLEDYSANPDATRTIVGDLEPTGAFDDLGNIITTGGADAPDRPDTLLGSAGNDLIQSRGGNDVVFAKAGDDTIEGGGGRDSLDGGAGKDILSGGADADVLYGGGGNDQLFADARIDAATVITQTATGGGGRELLVGGDGDDMLIGAGTADALMGGSNDDLLIGGAGDDDLLGDVDGVAVRFDGKPSVDWAVTRSVVEAGGITSYSLSYTNTLTAAEAAVAGMDTLYGGAGSDWLIAGGADDYLDGGADNDVLYGEAGNDALAGGDGDDVLVGDNPGQAGDDWLSGGAGVDRLFGGGGIDVLEGGAGQDFLAGGTGDDSYDFALGDGQDTVQDDDGFDVVLLPVNLADLRVEMLEGSPGYLGIAYGSQGDTLAIKDGLKGAIDFFTLNDGSYTLGEVLKKLKTKVTVVGTNPTGNALYGGANNDTLSAASGTNVFQAGDGINTISGGNGKDTYMFSRASASDTIRDAGGGQDNVQMIDLAPEEFEIYRDARSFQLVASATLDFITLVDGYIDPTARVETISFDDGTEWDYNYLVAHAVVVPSLGGVIIGTPADDVLTGSAGADWIYGLEGNDTITGLAGNDTIYAGAGDDVIDAGADDDTIAAGAGNDTLDGGTGNDQLDGGTGSDTYIVQGAGNKTIVEDAANPDGIDTLRLPQLTPNQIAATSHAAGDAITLRFGSGAASGTIVLPNSNDINSANNIEQIVFSDGTVWDQAALLTHTVTDPVVDRYFQSVAGSGATPHQTALEQHVFTDVIGDPFYGNNNLAGSDAKDTIYGAYGDDVLNGGRNADRLHGGGGNDTVDGGDGDDRVEGGNGADRLAGGDGDDVVVGGFGDDVLGGGTGTDVLYGGDGDDSYAFNIGDGFDTILDSTDTGSYTRVVNLYSDAQEFVTGAPNRVLFGAGITLDLLSAGQAGVFTTPGGITLSQASFNVGEGDDSIMLVTARGSGPAVQNFQLADGIRYTFDQLVTLTTRPGVLDGSGGADILAGSSADDRINGRGGNDYLLGAGGNDSLNGSKGDDFLEGGSGDDTLDGGPGSDRLEGGAGNDSYLFGRGYGVDTIIEDGLAASGANSVRLAGDVLADDVTLSRDGADNLLVTINGSADQLTVQGYFSRLSVAGHIAAPNPKIDQVVFGDGSVLTAAEIDTQLGGAGPGDDFVAGTAGSDMLNGLAGNDVLEGNAGDDTLDGGSGEDLLRGGAGNDSYRFGRGAGQDSIEENDATAGNLDTLQLAGDVLPGDVTLRRDFRVIDFNSNLVVDDLVLTINGSADRLTVRNYFATGSAKIERIVFGDGSILSSAALDALSNPATEDADVLVGTPGNDTIDGLAGDDTIYGRDGDDSLTGGEGYDALSGEDGNDMLAGGAGIDTLDGGAGDDLLGGGDEVDVLFGGPGADSIDGGAGNDFLHGDADNDFLAGGAGDDTLDGGDGGDVLLGEAGDDTLNGDAGDDLLVGGEGVDSLNGGEGNDTLSGGPGNDSLSGGGGDDRYVFVRGAGADTIVENDSTTGKIDTVVAAGLMPHEIVATKGPADSLVLAIADSGDQLTVQSHFSGAAQQIDRVEFEDGTVWDAAYIAALFLTVVPGATEFGDFISGGDTDDVIDGLGGNDVINGLGGNDLLLGGAGKDILDGGTGNDILDGGAGDDRLSGGAGNDTYRFARGGGRDQIRQSDNTAGRLDRLLLGPAIAPADITVTRGDEDGSSLFVSLNGGAERIALSGWYVSPANRLDRLVFDNGVVWDSTTIEAHQIVSIVTDGGQNSIFGTQGDDVLTGVAGSNHIFGFGGNDTLQGRQLSDAFDGGAGSDTYLFGRGDGNDAIEETNAPGDINIVRLGATVAPADVIVSRDYQNLYLKIAGSNDRLTLSQWFSGNAFNVQQVVFQNGTIWDVPTLRELANTPTAGNDVLTGTAGDDVIDALAGNDTVDGRGGNDTLLGGAGFDSLRAADGNNTFDGGADDDYLSGGAGDDTYVFGHGKGNDIVYDSGFNYTIRMTADVSPNQVTLTAVGDDLNIALNDSGESITVQSWFSTLDISTSCVTFENGTVWDSTELQSRAGGAPVFAFGRPLDGEISFFGGTDFSDPTIHGGVGLKEIFGGPGDDSFGTLASGNVLYGGSGSDTYLIESGAGRLVTIVETPGVVDGAAVNDANRIVFGADITPENLTIVSGALNHFRALDDYAVGGIYDAADLVIGHDNFGLAGAGYQNGTPWGGSRLPADGRFSVETGNRHSDPFSIQYGADEDRVLIKDGTLGRIQSYQFADGSVWSHAQLMANLAQRTDGSAVNDLVSGGLGSDIILGNGGDDVIAGLASGDYLYGGDGDDVLDGGAGDDRVFGGDGNDFIQGDTYHTAMTVFGTTAFGTIAGNDELHGNGGDDVVYGLDGNDTLYGDDGADWLDGGNSDDVVYGGSGDDILRGDLLANVVAGGNDMLDGGAGADDLQAGAGNDIYVVDNPGDMVVEQALYSNAAGLFTVDGGIDLVRSSITYTLTANVENLTLTGTDAIDGTGNALGNVIIGNAAANVMAGLGGDDSYVVDNAGDVVNEAADGGLDSVASSITYTLSDHVENLTLTGTAVIDGTGNALANTFWGNAANNMFTGGDGADTYHFGCGAGRDTVVDTATIAGADDIVQMAAGVAPDQVRVYADGNDLQLAIKFTSDRLILKDWLLGAPYQVEFVKFDDGTRWGVAELQSLAAFSAEVFVGTAGADQLSGGAGDDVLTGGAGDDLLTGGAGDDTYVFGIGDGEDHIVDGEGSNTISFGTGVAPDSLSLALGSLLIHYGPGTDAVHIESFDPQNASANPSVAAFRFADGSTLNFGQLLNRGFDLGGSADGDLIVGTNVVDRIQGLGGNDALFGGAGDDLLDGGAGDDVLSGGAGNDHYLFGPGGGSDRISGAGALATDIDTVRLGVAAADIRARRRGEDLVITLAGSGDALILENFDGAENRVGTVLFADGVSWDHSQLADAAINHAPTLAIDVGDVTTLEDMAFAFSLPNGAFVDPDAGDVLALEVTQGDGTPLPSWLVFDAATRSFSGMPLNPDVGVVSLKVMAIDDLGASGFDTFNLTVVNSNDAPAAADDGFVLAENATSENLAAMVLANDADPDNGDARRIIAIDASTSRGALVFDAGAEVLTYSATGAAFDILSSGAVATDSFSYTVADAAGAVSTATVTVSVIGVNDAPVRNSKIADQTATTGTFFTLTLAPDAFTDIDAGDVVSYRAQLANGHGLPDWLGFDALTRTFAGTAAAADAGSYAVAVFATDNGDLSASDTFTIEVARGATGMILTGTAFGDELLGGAGNDTLDGRGGADRLAGNAGDDTFVYYVDGTWSGSYVARNVGSPGNPGTQKNASIIGKNRSFEVFDGGAGEDVILGTAGDDAIFLDDAFSAFPGRRTARFSGIERIDGGAGNDVIDLTSDLYSYGNVSLDGNTGNDILWSSAGHDSLFGGDGNDDLFGGAGNDYLSGGAGRDTLNGDRGNDLLEGGGGDDSLVDAFGNNLLAANEGNDSLSGGDGSELYIGGGGNDRISTGNGADIIAFNRGDGRDTVGKSAAADNTLSLGGGIRYGDLFLSKQGKNLVLQTAVNEDLTFTDWYAGGGNRSISNLQMIVEAGADYLPGSTNVLRDNRIELFDFGAIVQRFDEARAAKPSVAGRWALMNALLDAHLGNGSDTEALGGDLAYRYGDAGALSGVGIGAAHVVLAGAGFGAVPQAFQPFSSLQDGMLKLG